MQGARAGGWHFLVRVNQDRRIETEQGKISTLIRHARSVPSELAISHWQRGRDGQPKQEIRLEVSSGHVWIDPPWLGAAEESTPIEAWWVRCYGERRGGDPIEWILLTDIAITDRGMLEEVISWYEHRWLIEEYHKCLKSGCRIESRQLRSGESLEALVGMTSIVAVELLRLRTMAREAPDQRAVERMDRRSIELLIAHKRLKQTVEDLTLREYWHAVARLGGFIGRKSDGDPGWQTLWDGWEQLQQMVWASRQPVRLP